MFYEMLKCVLPNTIPGITFNEQNECNYCNVNFPPYFPKGKNSLNILLQRNIKKGTPADCLVGFSGGKDSTYVLVKLREEFNMRVEAFTYVHEGSTLISIENAKNACKKLNIKHHLVTLKKQAHLKTFIGFFNAWIKAPSVTTAAMTCVACKHMHILGSEIAEKRNIPMIIWGSTPLEYPPYVAIKRDIKDNQLVQVSNFKSSILLLKEIVKSKEFLTTFLKNYKICYSGCLAVSPKSSYLKKKYPNVTPVFFFEYLDWNPKIIREYLAEKIGWKISEDKEDWHSDCIFHYFKDYMFINMMGASYYDAFLSNQIRHGLISREEALIKIKENKLADYLGIKKAIKSLNLHFFESMIDFELLKEK